MILEHMLQQILRDFLLMYKNFFHWNVSKIMIYIWAALFALLIASPFFAIAIAIGFYDPVNWQEIFGYYTQTGRLPITFMETIEVHWANVILNSSLILLWFWMLFVGWMQYLVTSSRLYLWYIDGEKLPFFANSYFSFAYFKKLTTFLGWFGLILLAPVLFFVVISAGAFFGIWYETIIQNDEQFVLIVALGFMISLVVFFYLTLRFGYGYLVLCDQKNYPEKKSWLFYVKESNKLTQWNMFQIVWITLLFAVCLYLPIEIFSYISSEVLKNDVITLIWGIVSFLLFSLTYEMLFVSMYRRILLKKHQKEISEQNKEEIV